MKKKKTCNENDDEEEGGKKAWNEQLSAHRIYGISSNIYTHITHIHSVVLKWFPLNVIFHLWEESAMRFQKFTTSKMLPCVTNSILENPSKKKEKNKRVSLSKLFWKQANRISLSFVLFSHFLSLSMCLLSILIHCYVRSNKAKGANLLNNTNNMDFDGNFILISANWFKFFFQFFLFRSAEKDNIKQNYNLHSD